MSQTSADFTPRRYEVRHRTTYTYEGTVDACYERGFLAPRDTSSQMVVSNRIAVDPVPHLISEHIDHFGNRSFYVEIRTAHDRLEVTKTSVLDVAWPEPDMTHLNQWTVGEAARILGGADPVERADFLLPSSLVRPDPALTAYAAGVLSLDMPLGDAVVGITHAIYTDFAYEPGATTVKTTLPELLEHRAGVCQDFTHWHSGSCGGPDCRRGTCPAISRPSLRRASPNLRGRTPPTPGRR